MRTILEKTLDLAFGAAALTRERVQEVVDELVKRGEVAREESGGMVEDILRRGQKQREETQAFVRREVSDALGKMNIATRDDLNRIERRIQELEVLVEDLRGGAPTAPRAEAEPVVLPPEAAPASTSEATETAAG